jgi:hypothetical protein
VSSILKTIIMFVRELHSVNFGTETVGLYIFFRRKTTIIVINNLDKNNNSNLP